MEEHIIGHLNNNPATREEIIGKFAGGDKNNLGLCIASAVLNLFFEGHISANDKGQYCVTGKGKKSFNL